MMTREEIRKITQMPYRLECRIDGIAAGLKFLEEAPLTERQQAGVRRMDSEIVSLRTLTNELSKMLDRWAGGD
jgi:hypothetical protein